MNLFDQMLHLWLYRQTSLGWGTGWDLGAGTDMGTWATCLESQFLKSCLSRQHNFFYLFYFSPGLQVLHFSLQIVNYGDWLLSHRGQVAPAGRRWYPASHHPSWGLSRGGQRCPVSVRELATRITTLVCAPDIFHVFREVLPGYLLLEMLTEI